jgi:hypothetical protein
MDDTFTTRSIYFDGDDCGIGIKKTETTTTTATTTTTNPAAPPAPAIIVNDKLAHAGATASHKVTIPAAISIVTISIRWSRAATFALKSVAEPGITLSLAKRVTKTSLTVTVTGVEPGRLTYSFAARKLSGPTAVTTRITRR